jgi:NAD(P)-dependent dehydrogenase (short-subunit alcohol dehydrogenase family)
VREIREETDNDRLHYYVADFSSLEEVHWLADEITDDHDRLDVLVNNAGIGAGRCGETSRDSSRDGYELRFAVNYLAPFLLTRLLLPLVRRAAPSRIVNVASAGRARSPSTTSCSSGATTACGRTLRARLALVMFAFDLAEELEDTSVTANSLHPASLMATKMVFETFGSASSSVREGTDAEVRLAISPELEGITGRYFDGQREAHANKQAYDPEARDRLRRLSEELTGLRASGANSY